MKNSLVVRGTRLARRVSLSRLATVAAASVLVLLAARPVWAIAQEAAPTGSIGGRIVDEQGAPIAGAQVFLIRPAIATATRTDGGYLLSRVPVGAQILRARLLGFRPDSASVTVTADQQVTQDFTLRRDPLQLQTLVVTGTQSPRMNLDASARCYIQYQ